MKKNNDKQSNFKNRLEQAAGNLKIDNHQTRKNMCTQFKNWREYGREYVVNAKDAGAKVVFISAKDHGDLQTIIIWFVSIMIETLIGHFYSKQHPLSIFAGQLRTQHTGAH